MTEYNNEATTTLESNETTTTFDDAVQTSGRFEWNEGTTVQSPFAPEGTVTVVDMPPEDDEKSGMGIPLIVGGALAAIGGGAIVHFVYKKGKALWDSHKEKVAAKKAYEEWLKNGNQVVGEPVKQETPVEETEGEIVD